MKKIIISLIFTVLVLDLFGNENYLENQKNFYVNNIKNNKNDITILFDIMEFWNINNYFDKSPFKKTILSIKTKNKVLDSYLDIFKQRVNKKIKIGYINNYYLIGPFDNQGKSGFLKKYLPEKEFFKNKKYNGKNEKVSWKTVQNYERSYINFRNFLNPKIDSLGYLLVLVKINKTAFYQIRFSTKNQYELFLDKKSILKSENNDYSYYDKNILNIYLKKGIHKILIKLDNKYGDWGVYLRVLDKDGKYSKKNIKFILNNKNINRYSKSKLISTDNFLKKQLDNIRNKDYKYYIKRALIERSFLPYDENSKPYPYEKYLKKSLELAKNDLEKGEAYYYMYMYNSSKSDVKELLNKSVKYNYYPAILEKIREDINLNELYKVKYLINKAKKIDEYDYRLLKLINRFYGLLDVNYLNRIIKRYQKGVRVSKFFEFEIDKMKFSDMNKLIKIYQYNENEFYFSIDDTFKLLNYYLDNLDFNNYEKLLNKKLKENYLSFDYNTMMITYLFSRRRYSDLIDLFNKRIELLEDSPKLIKIIAKTYQLLGDNKKSLKYYNNYLKLNPSDTRIVEYINYLKTDKKELWAKKYITELNKNDLKYSNYKSNNIPIEKLYEHTIVKINNDYSFNTYRKTAIAINNSVSAEKFKYLPIYYLPNNERVFNSYVRLIKKNGDIEEITNYKDRYYRSKSNGAFTNYSLRGYYLPNLEKGDIIEYSYYLKNKNIYENPFFSSVYNLNSSMATKRATFTFLIKNKTLNFNIKPNKVDNNKYFFEFKNLREVKNEPYSGGYSSNYKYLSVSTLSSWQELINWYKALLFKQDLLPKNVKNDLHKGTDNLKSLIDKIKWVHKYLFEHTHYIGIELGLNAYKPYSATEVLERKYGDCKDKANLFNSLLKEIGIKSEMVLLRTNSLGQINYKLPANPKYFNHAISYIPKLNLFVDLTAQKNGLFDLPFSDQEGSGIIIKNNEKLRILPSSISKEIINIDGIKSGKNLKAKILFTLKDSLASSFRYALENKESRKDYLQKMLKPTFNSFKIKKFKISNFDDINKDLLIEITLTINNFFSNKRLYSSIIIKKLLENIGLLNKRTENYKILKISIVENIHIKNINVNKYYENKDFKIDDDYIYYHSKLDNSIKDEVIITNKVIWKKFSIDINSYNKFRKGISEVTNFIKNNLVYLNGDK